MSNLPDNWSWRAFDAHFGDNEPPEPECCIRCGAGVDDPCDLDCDCEQCRMLGKCRKEELEAA